MSKATPLPCPKFPYCGCSERNMVHECHYNYSPQHSAMKQQALIISMTVAIALFSGCTVKNIHSSKSIETVESLADAQRLVSKGMTMAQVKARLGEPIERSTYNQQTRWGYAEVQTNLSGRKLIMTGFGTRYLPDVKSVIVIFSANGRVSKVEFNHQKYS